MGFGRWEVSAAEKVGVRKSGFSGKIIYFFALCLFRLPIC